MLKTKEQFFERISKMKRNLYVDGERVSRVDEMMQPTLDILGNTFTQIKHQA